MKSNVYAFGMLAYELLLRKEPYQDEDQGVLTSAFACHELGLHFTASKTMKICLANRFRIYVSWFKHQVSFLISHMESHNCYLA